MIEEELAVALYLLSSSSASSSSTDARVRCRFRSGSPFSSEDATTSRRIIFRKRLFAKFEGFCGGAASDGEPESVYDAGDGGMLCVDGVLGGELVHMG